MVMLEQVGDYIEKKFSTSISAHIKHNLRYFVDLKTKY